MKIPRTCQALVTKTPKTGKAYSIPDDPKFIKGETFGPCGGDLTFSIGISGDGRCYCDDYCYCEPLDIEVTITCSKCRTPWFPDSYRLSAGYSAKQVIEEVLNGG